MILGEGWDRAGEPRDPLVGNTFSRWRIPGIDLPFSIARAQVDRLDGFALFLRETGYFG
jgi:hypothetical protein